MDHSDIITETSFRNLSVSWETSKQLLSKWLESLQGSIVTPLDLDTVLLQCLATVFFLISVRFINSLVYYGLSLSTSDLGSNIYVAFFISGAVEIPAYFVGIPMMESRLGRRYSTSICELLGGVSCLLTILLPPGVGKTVIAMIGKFGISASFSLVYIYAAEVIPTPLRSVGVGLCSTAARVGGILSPLILLLDEIWKPLPLIIFGSSAIIGGLLVLLLPESRGKMLPETIEEGEIFSTRSKQSRMSAYKGISDKEEAV